MEEKKERMRFPDDEERFEWLPLLLESYFIVDGGVERGIARDVKERGRVVACKEGCVSCCRYNKDIPLYPHEMVGIYWYAVEKVKDPARATLRERLRAGGVTGECPFLIDAACVIYPMRPTACRHFVVFNEPCGEGEDPYYTRRDDLYTPLEENTDRAFMAALPFYGVKSEADKVMVIKNKLIHGQVQNLMEIGWSGLIEAMDDFDARTGRKKPEQAETDKTAQ